MKTCIRFLTATAACFLIFANMAFADGKYIADSDKTSAVILGTGEYEAVGEPDTNGIAITRDGVLIISPDAQGTIRVTDSQEESEITVLPAVNYDFETENAQFSGERAEGENGFYLNGGSLDMTEMSLSGGRLSLGFKLFKADTESCDLLRLNSGEDIAARIALARRSDEAVYFSYLEDGSMVRLRNVTMNIGEWLDAKAEIDLDEKKLELYIAGELLVTAPVAEFEAISLIGFETAIDDVVMTTGEAISESGIEIGLGDISVPADGVYQIDPLVKIKINDTWHDIDARYISLNAEGSGIVPAGGRIFVDGAAIEEPVSVKIACVAVVSGTEYRAEKTVTVASGGTDGALADKTAVFEPVYTDDGITLRIINGEGMNLKIIVCRTLDDGAMDFTAEDWTPDSADAEKTAVGDSNSTVYIIDTDSGANLLQQEGV